MVRVRGALVIALVAGEAILGCARVGVGVAGLAIDSPMSSQESKAGQIVIEARRRPIAELMTVFAEGREPFVGWLGSARIVALVTGNTVLRRAGIPAGVAGLAVEHAVGALERKGCLGVVEASR